MNGIGMVGSLIALIAVCLPVVFLLLSGTASAQPCTLYKEQDVENARQNAAQYGWAREIVEEWKSDVEFTMKQDRAALEAIVPEISATTHYNLTCPACVGKQSRMGRAQFSWDGPEAPDRITCNDCGRVYPNKDYPETGVLELPRMGQKITYYETPGEREHPEERAKYALTTAPGQPMMTSFSGLARLHRARWAANQALTLAKLYALTGEVDYVERCVWFLDRFVEVYPNYLWRTYRNFFVDLPPAEVAANLGKYGGGGRFAPEAVRHAYLNEVDREGFAKFDNGFWGGGRLEDHANDYRWILGSIVAYDLIRDAVDPEGNRLLDEETGRRIRERLLIPACEDWEHWGAVHNKGMGYYAITAALGVLLEQPERVRRALEGFNRMLAQRYQFDGFYTDTPGYGLYNFGQLRPLPDILLGYSDPPGYEPESGERIENLNLYEVGQYRLVIEAALRMLAPGNRLPVIADTVYGSTLSLEFVDFLAARFGGSYARLLESVQGAPLSEKGSEYSLWYRSPDLRASEEPAALPLRSEWFPGWHVGVLRGGREEYHDTAFYLTGHEHRWTLQTGHEHPDILAASFYAYGEELASDRGYYSGDGALAPDRPVGGQYWTKSTASHNIVLVDDKCQSSAAPAGSNLEMFGVTPGVEVVQASGFNVYPQCEEYRRTSALVRRPDGHSYVVDFFRAKGGENHKYCFHSNGAMVSMEPAGPAPEPVEFPPPRDEWDYAGWVKNPRAVVPESPYTFSWKSGEVNLDVHVLNSRKSVDRILIVDAPGWRHQRPAEEFEKPPVQQIMAEHSQKAGDTLTTGFAAVWVPYREDDSPVLEARLLEEDAASGVLAVEVRLEGRTDYIISARDQELRQYGPVRVAGEFAFVSVDAKGQVAQGYLLKGTRLECGDFRIELPAESVTLPVRSVSDRTFHLTKPLPEGMADRGSYVLASGPAGTFSKPDAPPPQTGFEIEAVTSDAITVRDYPAVDCGEVTIPGSRWVNVAGQ